MATGKRVKKKLRNTVQISSSSVPLRTGQEIIDREEWQAKHMHPGGILEYKLGDEMKDLYRDLYGSIGITRRQPETHTNIITTISKDIEYSKDTFSDYNKENPIWKFIKSTLSHTLVIVLTRLGIYNNKGDK